MAEATVRHNTIVDNLGRDLHPRLKGRCRHFATDVRLLIPATGLHTYPDLMVICGAVAFEGDRQDVVTNPRLIIEVLSKSTATYDRGRKFVHYRSIPSLMDYLMLSQDSVRAEHYTRHADGSWLFREYASIDDVLHIASIGADISLVAAYED